MTKELNTEEYAKLVTAKYQAELVRRYLAGEYLTKTDRAEARRIAGEHQ